MSAKFARNRQDARWEGKGWQSDRGISNFPNGQFRDSQLTPHAEIESFGDAHAAIPKYLVRKLELRGVVAEKQQDVNINYKDCIFTETLKYDILVAGCLLIEVKAVQEVIPIHKAKLLSYMKLLDVPLGLVINFHAMKVVDGLSRMILPGANL